MQPQTLRSSAAKFPGGNNEYRSWEFAFRVALINALVFFLFSAVVAAPNSVPIALQCLGPGIFAVGSGISFYLLSKSGGSLAAVSYFVLGSGLMFGFGAVYSTEAEGYVFQFLFSEADQGKNFPTINLMNSLSVLIVLTVAWRVCKLKGEKVSAAGMGNVIGSLEQFRAPILIVSGVFLALIITTFPIAEDLILRNAIEKLRVVPMISIFIGFSRWSRGSVGEKVTTLFLLNFMALYGILEASKMTALLPVLAATGGLFFDLRYRQFAVFAVIVTAVWYFSFLNPTVTLMRAHWQYNVVSNTIVERLDIMVAVNTEEAAGDVRARSSDQQLLRFVHAPYQSYLINEWRDGRPGSSLSDWYVALIPRVLWPDKPIITRFAAELYSQIYGVEANSNQAPTYTGEAFWNYGWLGVIVVSLVLGLEIGWLTRKWLQVIYGNSPDRGILIMSIPVVILSASTETWIAASYVGGFLTIVVLIKAADMLLPYFTWGGGGDRAITRRSLSQA